jgi:hypothetical protein
MTGFSRLPLGSSEKPRPTPRVSFSFWVYPATFQGLLLRSCSATLLWNNRLSFTHTLSVPYIELQILFSQARRLPLFSKKRVALFSVYSTFSATPVAQNRSEHTSLKPAELDKQQLVARWLLRCSGIELDEVRSNLLLNRTLFISGRVELSSQLLRVYLLVEPLHPAASLLEASA